MGELSDDLMMWIHHFPRRRGQEGSCGGGGAFPSWIGSEVEVSRVNGHPAFRPFRPVLLRLACDLAQCAVEGADGGAATQEKEGGIVGTGLRVREGSDAGGFHLLIDVG